MTTRQPNARRAVDKRLDLDALIKRRDELAAEHATAVRALERAAEAGEETHRIRRGVERLYDELADEQRRIDGRLASERAR